ncbi:MAG: HDOD domain-containing protein [Hydrogenophilales bacterium]|nr:HDOD domain-containing protein [Hydrogenophilales bacterium]
MPHVLLKLLTMDEAEPGGLWLEAIGEDPALTARLISAWRTNAADSNGAPAGIARAIAALGTDRVRAIVRNAAIQQVFSPLSSQPCADLKKHWWRAILCANLAEQLSLRTAYPHPQEARLGGILCGLDPLARWAASFNKNGEIGVGQAEGVRPPNDPQPRIAAGLVLEWRLHPFLADAIRYHQEAVDQLADTHSLVRIVHLANRLANYLTGAEPLPLDAARLFFGLETLDLDRLAAAAQQSTAEIARKFSIEFEEKTAEPPEPPPGERRLHRNALAGMPLQAVESPVDAQIKLDLAREVRDLALMDSLRDLLSEANGFDEMLAKCTEGAHMLFGLAPPLYFVMDKEHKLRAHPLAGQDPRTLELTLAMQGGRSLAAAALGKNLPLNSLSDHAGTVLDRQMSRLLSSSGVLYLPFAANGTLSALAAFGIEPHQRPRLGKQRRLMSRFGRACAQALQSGRASGTGSAELMREKLSAMQIKTRRVAHEVNNPLSIMKNYVKLLSMKLGDDEEAKNDLRIFNDEIDRIASIIRSLASLAAPAPAADAGIDINGVIRDLIELASDTLFTPAKISVKTHLAEDLPPISTQRDKLKQILLNLLKNAAEAMPGGGTVTIMTRDNVNRDGRPYVEIMVSDTGPGMTAEVMAHLFEPVTSTKGGDHAGLGLAIVNQLVEEIHASITCISERSGLAFHLLIPKTITGG